MKTFGSAKYQLYEYYQLGEDCPAFSTGKKELNDGLYGATNGNVCQTGCAWFSNGNCPGYKTLTRIASAKPVPLQTETVKQQAQRESISISEVRRRRREKESVSSSTKGAVSTWIKNMGTCPDVDRVHIKMFCDEEDQPGIQVIRYNEDPKRWDWIDTSFRSGIAEYMLVEEGE